MSTEAVQTQVQHLSTQDEAAQGLHSGPVSVNFHPYLLAIVHLSHRSNENGWVAKWLGYRVEGQGWCRDTPSP